jgi:hypothetical protein
MSIEKRMRKITINNREEEKSYVHYTKRNIRNLGLPTGGNAYGNGVFVVLARFQSNTARVMPSEGKGRQQQYRFKQTAADGGGLSLKQQQLTFDNDNRCTNAYKLLINSDFLLGSYGKIKSKPGNMTPGSDTTTLDGISIKYVENLNRSLKEESWSPKPTRRVYIEKANGKKRPLGISSPRDKIVQESMRKVLESVLEPKFMDCSHGFRPGRSCHSALAKIRY